MEAAGQACADGHPAHDAVPSRPVGPSPAPRPPPAPGRGRRQLRTRRRGRGGRGEGRREGGFLPPHTQSPSRIYRVSRLGAERQEQLPRGRSTSRSPGEGPGFRGPLVEPAPRQRSRYTQGRSRAARAPTPLPARSQPGWPGGRARRGLQRGRGSSGAPRQGGLGPRRGLQRGRGSRGVPLQGGLGPRRGDARFPRLCLGAASGRPQPSGRGLGALGAGIVRQGGSRGGGKGARVGNGQTGLTWEPRRGRGPGETEAPAGSGGGLLGPRGCSRREQGHVGRGGRPPCALDCRGALSGP